MVECTVARAKHEGFEITLPSEHVLLKKSMVPRLPIPFKTKSGVQSALAILNKNSDDPTPFSLYLSKREIVDNYSAANQSSNRTYFKLAHGHEKLIDAIMDDWSGTEVGFSLHKCFQNDLGEMIDKSTEGKELLSHLIKNTNVFLNAHSMNSLQV